MKKTWFFSAVVIGWVVFSSISLGYSGGDGTSGNPYQIANANNLLELAADTGNYDKCFILTADIDLGGQVFTTAIIAPDIDSSTWNIFEGTAFWGTFDGDSYKITNFKITGVNKSYLGLFGNVASNGLIENLGIENCTVGVSTSWFVGGLAGYNSGNISNCHVTGKITAEVNCGGLVGHNDYGNISTSYSTGTVTCSDIWEIGGLAGTSSYGSISQCYSTCKVYSYDDSVSAGGLVGTSYYSIISNCYATGAVNGYSHVGGLVGSNYGSISQCYSTGVVSGTYCGGLIGSEMGAANSFWDTQTSGTNDSAGGKPRNTIQMKQAANYTGWNTPAQTIWTLDEGNDYPRLAWQNLPGTPLPAQTLNDFILGQGTLQNPYQISTAEQLNAIGLFPDYWNKTFRLENNINLSGITGTGFNKIGISKSLSFTGNFDGNMGII
jgi:hypothetical protein